MAGETPKPDIDRLLIASALDADLRRRLLESPDEAFRGFDLTEDEKDLLRRPDHRLLPLLGAALARQTGSRGREFQAPTAPQPHAVVRARTLSDVALALTLVPCAQYEKGRLNTIAYAVWVNPLPPGADPAGLPAPGSAFPGQPLTPLHMVIQVSAVATENAAGSPQIGLTASLRQSSNVAAPPPPETAGIPSASLFGSELHSPAVEAAVAAVRGAPNARRYDALLDLLQALRGEEAL
jgi:hypothetical protein